MKADLEFVIPWATLPLVFTLRLRANFKKSQNPSSSSYGARKTAILSKKEIVCADNSSNMHKLFTDFFLEQAVKRVKMTHFFPLLHLL